MFEIASDCRSVLWVAGTLIAVLEVNMLDVVDMVVDVVVDNKVHRAVVRKLALVVVVDNTAGALVAAVGQPQEVKADGNKLQVPDDSRS